MSKKNLIIGGTYFLGRVFSILAYRKGYELTFINRGRFSMKNLGEHVREFACDRHDSSRLQTLKLESVYDVVVDFCAYMPGDIQTLCEALPCRFIQYIYLSTADVYERLPGMRTEGSPLQSEEPSDEVGLYTYRKMLLEQELKEMHEKECFAYTILRPAFVFGPYNYAPRESWFIQHIIQDHFAYYPSDSTGQFQMVYVKDAAEAIICCIENEKSQNKSYNICAPEILDYRLFLDELKKASGIVFEEKQVTVARALAAGIPFPFPLTEEESELFDGSKITRELNISYTAFPDALLATYNAMKGIYQ